MKHSTKIIYATLLISIVIHIGLLLSTNLFASKTVTETELKPVTITLQQYTLEEPPPQTTEKKPVKEADNQPKPTTEKTTSEKVKPQSQADNKGISGLKVKPIKPKGPTKKTTPEDQTKQDKQTSEDTDNPDVNTKSKKDDPENNGSGTETADQSDPKTTKLSSKDIAENNGIIAPKDGQKPPFPKNAVLHYQGPASTEGTMKFSRGAGRYQINAQFKILTYKIELSSTGRLNGNQFIPEEFTDKRRGKLYSQAIFDYENNVVKYGKTSGEIKEEPMQGIPQDYLSLAWQMAVNGGRLTTPTQVTSGKTIYVRNSFTPEGEKELDTNEGKIKVQVFRINKGDDGIEFSFAPDFANIPAQVTLYREGSKDTLNLIGITMDGQEYWKAIRRSGASKNK